MNDRENKRGFSGLSDLASDIRNTDELTNPEPSPVSSKPSQPIPRPTMDNKTDRISSDSLKLNETVRSGKSAGGSGWKFILGIIGIIFVIWLVSYKDKSTEEITYKPSPSASQSQNSKKPSYNSLFPLPHTKVNQATINILDKEIERGKKQVKQMEIQLKEMDGRLGEYKGLLIYYRDSDMADDYNNLAPTYFTLVGERKEVYEKYSRLINELNIKIRRYNSGSR